MASNCLCYYSKHLLATAAFTLNYLQADRTNGTKKMAVKQYGFSADEQET
jgi:hypothetical protein